MEKRGQAFLISSIVIIMVLVAFVTIANYSKKTTFSTFPYAAEEIQIESEKVMDYALLNNKFNEIEDFTKDVSDYIDKDTRIYFIEDSLGSLKFYNITDDLTSDLFINGEIIATLDNTDYFFPKTEGKHFYFIMIKEIKGEKYVYTNA